MADNEVVKTIENVDALFAQIVVNGEVHESSSYVAPEATTPSSSQSQQTTVVEEEEEPEATDGTGEDVYAIELNDTLHNFVDRAVGEALQSEIQTRGEADLQLHNSVVSLGQRVVQAESSVESLSGQVTTFGTELGNVEDLIPSTATPQNKLADKAFVNSSIATNTANFLGTYTSLEQIIAIANPTNNDFAFLQTVDQAGNTVYQRYKYNATQSSWLFEYSLNNSSFTAEQWATINSGLTQNLVDTAIANALDSLDVASVGGSGKYIESISQVDGAIVPVEATIADEVTIGNIHSVSSDAVANALEWEDITNTVTLSKQTSSGAFTSYTPELISCYKQGSNIKLSFFCNFTASLGSGYVTLKIKVTSSKFTMSSLKSRVASCSYYGGIIIGILTNEYGGETNMINIRIPAGSTLASGSSITVDVAFPV